MRAATRKLAGGNRRRDIRVLPQIGSLVEKVAAMGRGRVHQPDFIGKDHELDVADDIDAAVGQAVAVYRQPLVRHLHAVLIRRADQAQHVEPGPSVHLVVTTAGHQDVVIGIADQHVVTVAGDQVANDLGAYVIYFS